MNSKSKGLAFWDSLSPLISAPLTTEDLEYLWVASNGISLLI